MKKFTNFIGEGIGPKFLHDIRRVATTVDFWRVCEEHLNHDAPMPLEPSPDALAVPA
jgi:ribosome-binding ATPase YchF (GTP1/OBG family)